MSASGTRVVMCPRCGYDQRGIVESWRESCPLQSTCAECGLVYSCGEVMCPEKYEPAWCVEYCPEEPREFIRSCGRTCAKSFAPWRFWSLLYMSHRIRPKRIVLYVAVILLPAILLYITAQTWVALYVRASVKIDLVTGAQRMAAWAAQQPSVRPVSQQDIESMQRQYPEDWQDRLERSQQNWESWLDRTIAASESPPYLNHSAALAVLEAVFLPLASQSRLTIMHPVDDAVQPYRAPNVLWHYALGRDASRYVSYVVAGIAFGVVLALLFPVSLVLLPLSRHRAKVRWAHIARITAYWSIIPTTAVYLCVAVGMGLGLRLYMTGGGGGESLIVAASFGFIPAATILWWTFAIGHHLKMRNAFAVAIILSLLCFLTILAAVYLFKRSWLFGPYE